MKAAGFCLLLFILAFVVNANFLDQTISEINREYWINGGVLRFLDHKKIEFEALSPKKNFLHGVCVLVYSYLLVRFDFSSST